MIKILFDLDQFQLVYAVASVLKKYEATQKCLMIPVKTEFLPLVINFTKKIKEADITDSFDSDEYYEDFVQENVILGGQNNQDKIILVGVHPSKREDEMTLYEFAEEFSDNILLWVDNHRWPSELLKHIQVEKDKMKIDENQTCLEILSSCGYFASRDWLKSEKALIENNWRNKEAKRYLQAYEVNRTIDRNLLQDGFSDTYFYNSVVHELLMNDSFESITKLANSYSDMKYKTEKAKRQLDDQNPAFTKAKQMGRKVGCLTFDSKVENYLDIYDILNYGIKKYPWLCVVTINTGAEPYIYARSKKMPIHKIFEMYDSIPLNSNNSLQIINAEVVKYRKKRRRRKTNV